MEDVLQVWEAFSDVPRKYARKWTESQSNVVLLKCK